MDHEIFYGKLVAKTYEEKQKSCRKTRGGNPPRNCLNSTSHLSDIQQEDAEAANPANKAMKYHRLNFPGQCFNCSSYETISKREGEPEIWNRLYSILRRTT